MNLYIPRPKFSLLGFSLIFFLSLTYCIQGFCQNSVSGHIKGKIINSDSAPVEYGNLLLLNVADSSFIKGSVSDANGKYFFENIKEGKYFIVISCIGYKKNQSRAFEITSFNKNVDLGIITISEDLQLLGEVVIKGEKPLFEQEIDKMVINVQNSVISAGASAMEILEKAPGVTVSGDGNVSLKGKEGVIILINGRPTYLSAEDLSNRLKSMPGASLEKIEVITNPSAKYDAAGNAGIINLVLKKDENDGFNGNISGGISYGLVPKYNGGINFNYRKEKVNVFGGYNYSYNLSKRFFNVSRNDNITDLKTYNVSAGVQKSHHLRFGLDYYITKNDVVGVLVSANRDNELRSVTNETFIGPNPSIVDSSFISTDDMDRFWNNYSLNLNYKKNFSKPGHELSSDLDISRFKGQIYDEIGTHFFYADIKRSKDSFYLRNWLPSAFDVVSVKIDYSHPIKEKSKVETGIKSSYVVSDNEALFLLLQSEDWIKDKSRTNHFKYDENINALYAVFNQKFNKTELKLGLRAEHTVINGISITLNEEVRREYFNLFPSLFLTHELNQKNKLNFAYSRRIDRPNYKDLNPFIYFIDYYTYFRGNPYLNPQLTNSFGLTYLLNNQYSLAINHSRTSSVFTYIYALENQQDGSQIWSSSMGNLDKFINYSLTLNAPFEITPWWKTNNNLLVFYNMYHSLYEGGLLDNEIVTFNLNTNHSFKLPHDFKLELSFFHKTPSVYGFHIVKPQSSLNFGLQKALLDNRAKVSFNVSDILNTMQWSSNMYFNDLHVQYYNKWETRIFRVNFNYQFGKNKVKGARNRKIGSEEENRRVGQ